MNMENGILFLGTGSSSSIPNLSHVFKNSGKVPNKTETSMSKLELNKEDFENINELVDEIASKGLECVDELNNLYLKKLYSNYPNLECYTCFDALSNDSKNKRNNISLLLKSSDSYVLIDVGKTFRDSILFNRDKINFNNLNLEMVLISHSHTDALNGIDDLRDLQSFAKIIYDDLYYYKPKKMIDVYLNEMSYDRLLHSYAYLAEKRTEQIFYSKVAALNIFILKNEKYNKMIYDEKKVNELKDKSDKLIINKITDKGIDYIDKKKLDDNADVKSISVNIHNYDLTDEYGFTYTKFDKDKNIRFIPFEHGKNFVCIGYIIGKNNKLVYISDCSNLPNYVLEYIKQFEPIDILIIDALFYKIKHYSHFSLYQSMKLALQINPKKVYFIGMSCNIEYNIVNLYFQKISKKFPDISFSLAYDGLFVPFDF